MECKAKHRANITRILRGTKKKLSAKKQNHEYVFGLRKQERMLYLWYDFIMILKTYYNHTTIRICSRVPAGQHLGGFTLI